MSGRELWKHLRPDVTTWHFASGMLAGYGIMNWSEHRGAAYVELGLSCLLTVWLALAADSKRKEGAK